MAEKTNQEFGKAIAKIMGFRLGEIKGGQINFNPIFEGEEAWRVTVQIKPTVAQINKLKTLITRIEVK